MIVDIPNAKRASEITHAEWIVYRWIEVTNYSDNEPIYIRGSERPLDEAMILSGGSIKTLMPYLWTLREEVSEHEDG